MRRLRLQFRNSDHTGLMHMRPVELFLRVVKFFGACKMQMIHKGKEINPRSANQLLHARIQHLDYVDLTIDGSYEKIAEKFLPALWAALDGEAERGASRFFELSPIVDRLFQAMIPVLSAEESQQILQLRTISGQGNIVFSRRNAVTNDRIHTNIVLLISAIGKTYESNVRLLYYAGPDGIYCMDFCEANQWDAPEVILRIDIPIGAQITVVSDGPKRRRCAETVCSVLDFMCETDFLLRRIEEIEYGDAVVGEIERSLRVYRNSIEGEKASWIKNPCVHKLLQTENIVLAREEERFDDRHLGDMVESLKRSEDIDLPFEEAKEGVLEDWVKLNDSVIFLNLQVTSWPRIAASIAVYRTGFERFFEERIDKKRIIVLLLHASDARQTFVDFARNIERVFCDTELVNRICSLSSEVDVLKSLEDYETKLFREIGL